MLGLPVHLPVETSPYALVAKPRWPRTTNATASEPAGTPKTKRREHLQLHRSAAESISMGWAGMCLRKRLGTVRYRKQRRRIEYPPPYNPPRPVPPARRSAPSAARPPPPQRTTIAPPPPHGSRRRYPPPSPLPSRRLVGYSSRISAPRRVFDPLDPTREGAGMCRGAIGPTRLCF
jgi:hypothetical protein